MFCVNTLVSKMVSFFCVQENSFFCYKKLYGNFSNFSFNRIGWFAGVSFGDDLVAREVLTDASL